MFGKEFIGVIKGECPEYVVRSVLENFSEIVVQWAFIRHDKDLDVEPHYHVYLRSKPVMYTYGIERLFGECESSFRVLLGSIEDVKCYFEHYSDEYSSSGIVSNFKFE